MTSVDMYYLIRSTSTFMAHAQSLSNRSGTLSGQPPRVWSDHIRPLRLWPVTDH